MTATATVGTWLKADVSVAAIVAARVYAGLLPERVTLPAICVQRLSDEPYNHLQGHGGLDRNTVTVDVYAVKYVDAAPLQAAVRTCLQGQGVICETESDDYDSAVQLYRISSQWSVFT